MIGTGMKRRGWFALALLAGLAGLADAQGEKAITLSTDPDNSNKTVELLTLRPNVSEDFFVFVKNPTREKATLSVQLRDARGNTVLAQGKIELAANDPPKRVRLEKVAPPAPKGPAAKEAAPKEATPKAAAPVAEPPPGVELKRGASAFAFQLWLFDGDKVLENEKRTITVLMVQPGNKDFPISPPIADFTETGVVTIKAKTNSELRGGPAVVELVIPPQENLSGNLRSGFYRRIIAQKGQDAVLQAEDLPFKGTGKKIHFHLNVDGLQRAFVFNSEPAKEIPPSKPIAIRIVPIAGERSLSPVKVEGVVIPTYSAKPSERTSVRIEVDNAPTNAKLELRFEQGVKGDFPNADVFELGSVLDERVYLDFQNEDGGLQARYLATDRVHQLDTRSLRGKFGVQAVVNGEAKNHIILVLDDTPPENVEIDVPEKHIRGTLLTVKATAKDPETRIAQAIFFVGEAADGKLPDIKAKGVEKDGVWTAKLPVPDKAGPVLIGVQFMNETGVTTTEPKQIELVDPPTTGWIQGTVELGGRGQPGVVVSLLDAEGKVKGTAVTEDEKDNKPNTPKEERKVNGRFKIDNVPAGTHRISAAKPDSGVGTKGNATAQVQVGKGTEVKITLGRGKQ